MTELRPADPLALIRRCVEARRVLWTYHVNMRLGERAISRPMVLESVASYEIIEDYADRRFLPSYLVRAQHGSVVLHIVFALDAPADAVHVVTAYRPDPEQWSTDLRTRRPR